jgi:hypothetical protein
MTSMPGRIRAWLAARHSLRAEVLVVLGLYGVYEATRGLVVGHAPQAVGHARELVEIERSLGLFFEERVQELVHAVPGLIDVLSFSYVTLHLFVTVGVLIWIHQRRPRAFPLVRTALVVSSGLALIGYFTFPTAPPRLIDVGIADTVSNGTVDMNSGLVSALYNPYAAVPSMHFGYALVVGAAVAWQSCHRMLRLAGWAYPAFVLLVTIATGNHFWLDAAAGAAVVALGLVAARMITARQTTHDAVILNRLPAPQLHPCLDEGTRHAA